MLSEAFGKRAQTQKALKKRGCDVKSASTGSGVIAENQSSNI
jgi:hypothetical protein